MMTAGRYDEAARTFAHALNLEPKNASLWVAYGDAMNQLSPDNVEWMTRAQHAWENALVADPTYKPALERMMQFWSDIANMDQSQPRVFTSLRETATKLFEADPQNQAAEVAISTSVVRAWLGGAETDRKTVEVQIARLLDLIKKYPENPDLPMFAAQAKLKIAEGERQHGRNESADALTIQASQIINDAMRRTPTAAMYFSAAQVYQAQELNEAQKPKGSAQAWRDQKRAAYTWARQLAKQDDPLYVYIFINAARAIDNKAEAEKVLRELYASRPDDQQVRLALADHLAMDRGKREEAMAILEKPFATNGLSGPKCYLVRELRIRTLVMLTNLRIEAYAQATQDQRKSLLPDIQTGLMSIELMDGVGARVLRLRGKLLRLQGQTIEAIQTLEKARGLAERPSSNGELANDRFERWEIIDMLARAYIETNQIGQAKTMLRQLVERFPQYDPARKLLMSLLAKDGSFDEARKHIEYFKAKDPNDPDVIRIELQISDAKSAATAPAKSNEAVRASMDRLPEKTKQELLDKLNAAMALELQDAAKRLLTKLLAEHAGDYDVARMAVKCYRAMGDLDQARSAVEVSLKANPNDPQLAVLKQQVADLTPQGLMKVRREEIAKNPDEFMREVGFADCDRRDNKPEESLKHLMRARTLQPRNTDVAALLFSHHLWQKQYDQAEALLDELSRANQDQTGGTLFKYRLAMAKEDYQTALSYASDLTRRMSEFGQSWLALAQAQQAMKQYDEALKSYAAALAKQSDSPEALKGAIECYYALNRVNDAGEKIRDARRMMPGNAIFQDLEANHELRYGDPAKAIAAREQFFRKVPSAANTMALGEAYLATARSLQNQPGKADQAAQNFTRARDTFRQGLTKWPDEVAFYAYYAETGMRSGEFGDTEQLLKALAAREAWKSKPEPQMLLAEFYGMTNRYAEAESILRALMTRQPGNVDAEIRLANLLANQKKIDEALRALESNADDPRVARRRSELLLARPPAAVH